jgi:hypothetical protein
MSDLKRCPYCNALIIGRNAVICVNCGKNLKTGQQLNSKIKKISGKSSPPVEASVKNKKGNRRIPKALIVLLCIGGIGYAAVSIVWQTLTYDAPSVRPRKSASLLVKAKYWLAKKRKRVITLSRKCTNDAKDTASIVDDKIKEKVLSDISFYKISINNRLNAKPYPLSLHGEICFYPDRTHDIRLKIYRSADAGNSYKLIYNEKQQSVCRRAYRVNTTGYDRMRKIYEKNKSRMSQAQKNRIEQHIKRRQALIERSKRAAENHQQKMNKTYSVRFSITDSEAVKCGANNIFYKIKLCTPEGIVVKELAPKKVALIPRVKVADDCKSWSWTPFYPGKDPVDGVVAETACLPAVCVRLGNHPITKNMQYYTPRYYAKNKVLLKPQMRIYTFGDELDWYYRGTADIRSARIISGSGFENITASNFLASKLQQPSAGIVYDSLGFAFCSNFDIKFDEIKLNGQHFIPMRNTVAIRQTFGKHTSKDIKMYYYRFYIPGRVSLSFRYKGKPVKMKFVVPPLPTGVKAVFKDGDVRLRWDSISSLFAEKDFMERPKFSIFRNMRLIARVDMKENSYLDKNVFLNKFHSYEVRLDSGLMNVPFWSADKGVRVLQLPVSNMVNPCRMFWNSVVYAASEKINPRPLNVSVWKSDICYSRTAVPAVKLKSKVFETLKRSNCLIFGRANRKEIIQEKVLTMSYEKAMAIQSVPADFSVFIRDYSRQSGNGLELWLIKNSFLEVPGNVRQRPPSPRFRWGIAWKVGFVNVRDKAFDNKLAGLCEKMMQMINEQKLVDTVKPDTAGKSPRKLVYLNLQPLRQRKVVFKADSISETLMLMLAEKLDDWRIISRDEWRSLYDEHEILRDNGEKFDRDISGSVLLSGNIWNVEGGKAYQFIASNVKNGQIIGVMDAEGEIMGVAEKLAVWCRGLKVPKRTEYSPSPFRAAILGRESEVKASFFNRFGVFSKKYQSWRNSKVSLSKTSFAVEQWKLGNRQQALRLVEAIWRQHKKSGLLLANYYHQLGQYAKEMKVLEELMLSGTRNSYGLVNQYAEAEQALRSNRPPGKILKQPGDQSTLKADSESPTYRAMRKYDKRGKRVKFKYPQYTSNSRDQESFEKHYYKYFNRFAPEWNPSGKLLSYFKTFILAEGKISGKTKNLEQYGAWTSTMYAAHKESVYLNEALWEPFVQFGGQGSKVDRGLYLEYLRLIPDNFFVRRFANEIYNKLFQWIPDHSSIRVMYELANNMNMPFDNFIAPIGSGSLWTEQRRREYLEQYNCRTGYAVLVRMVKSGIRAIKRKMTVNLYQMVAADILAEHGDLEAKRLLHYGYVKFPETYKQYMAMRVSHIDKFDALYFWTAKGNKKAEKLLLEIEGSFDYYMAADICFLLALKGRKEALGKVLRLVGNSFKTVQLVRFGNKKVLRQLMLEKPECFSTDIYFYLADGLEASELQPYVFSKSLYSLSNYRTELLLFTGKPLPDVYRDFVLKSIKEEKHND